MRLHTARTITLTARPVVLDGMSIEVYPVAEGAAAALVPQSRSLGAQALREMLFEVAQAILAEVQAEVETAREIVDIKFFATPCEIGGFVGVVVTGVLSSGVGGAVAAVLVFLMIAILQYREQRTDTP